MSLTAFEICDSILRSMEAIIVGCRSGVRPHLRALQFGGAARLARELVQFMNYGSIHRDKFGEECCLPYLRSLYCPVNGHLLRNEWKDADDITNWLVDMVVEATLSDALVAVTSEVEKLKDHYERDAPILCQASVDRIVRGAKCLDEMDADQLAEVQIAATTNIQPSSPQTFQPSKVIIKHPKLRLEKSSRAASISTPAEAKKVSLPKISPPQFIVSPTPPMQPSSSVDFRTASEQFSSSCPCLTEIGFRRFLISKNWSLPEDDEHHKNLPHMEEPDISKAPSEKRKSVDAFSNLGARPKIKPSSEIDESIRVPAVHSIFAFSDDSSANVEHFSSPLSNGAASKTIPKRRTHRRSNSDSCVKTTNAVCVSSVRLPAVNEGSASNARQDQECIEGYEDGPSHYSYHRFPSAVSGPSSSGSWSELRPPSSGWRFPQPAFKDQSLFNYIISGQFSKHQAPLDQENAHLILAEAVINNSSASGSLIRDIIRSSANGASRRTAVDTTTNSSDSSNSNINSNNNSNDGTGESDDLESAAAAGAEKGEEGLEGEDEFQKMKRNLSRLVLSDGSPLHERSAEATALRLLLNLKDPHQLKASDLACLVSEQDAPRGLLPLPPRFVALQQESNSADASATNGNGANHATNDQDGEDDFGESTALRGTLFWAPPRPQLILKMNKKPSNVKEAMLEQNYLCHDCGMKVEREFIHTFRFCFYFGKFACTTCHSNKTHVLPANIIQKWDFKDYRVSDYAFNVLRGLSSDHLFAVAELNPDLPKRIRKLRTAIALRHEAQKMVTYIVVCRLAKDLITELDFFVQITDPELFSLHELCHVKSGNYIKKLRQQMDMALEHILECELCSGRGFICEGCHSKETLFPFQLDTVTQCVECRACYHKSCVRTPCSKCVRLKKR